MVTFYFSISSYFKLLITFLLWAFDGKLKRHRKASIMSDIDTLIAAFQTQLSDVMKTILKTAMYEVTKLVEDGLMEQLRSRNHEVESLKVQLQLAEKHLNDEYVVRKNEECDYNHGNSDLDELIEWHSDSGVAEGSGLKLGKNCLSDSMGSFRQEVMTNVGETHTAEKLTPNISPKRDTQCLLFNKATEEDNDRPAVVVKAEADVKPSCSIDHQEEGWSDGVCRSQFHNLNEILDLQSKQTQRSTKELSETDIGQAGHSSPITFTGDNEDLVSPLDSKPGGLSPMQNNTLNIADDSEPALLSGSTIQICNKLVGPASICIDHGNNRDQIYSKSKLQIAHVGDMVIKQEMLLDSDEDKEDKKLLEKEATGSTIAFPSCPEKNYMERSHVGLNYISHKPKMQEVTKRHFKVGTSLSFQAAVRHHRPVKKTHHTLLSNTSTAHSFATSLNLHNRTPPSFKVAVPPNSAQPANLSDKRNKTESQNCLPLVNIKASYQAENSQQANLQAFPGSHSQGPRHLLRCGQCGKCFPHPSNLKAHLQIHTGERPFSCSQCGRSFTKLSNLKAHRRVHTGERPYCCLACGKRFTQKCNLKRHQRIHLDV